MGRRTHIVVAEPSVIIRSGMVTVLKRLGTLDIDIAEINDIGLLITQLRRYKPDILIINPSHLGMFSMRQIKNESGCESLKVIALQVTLADSTTLKNYDDSVSIYDSVNTIKEKLTGLINPENNGDERQELSVREKEIVACIAKGMSTKQIAENLCVSVHTVMTHRRNISSKLQIHSPAGITIYAIVNKLVEIDEIKNDM